MENATLKTTEDAKVLILSSNGQLISLIDHTY